MNYLIFLLDMLISVYKVKYLSKATFPIVCLSFNHSIQMLKLTDDEVRTALILCCSYAKETKLAYIVLIKSRSSSIASYEGFLKRALNKFPIRHILTFTLPEDQQKCL